jgi:hypothetical protein
MNVSKLSKVELNRKMVELQFGTRDKDIERLYRAGKLNYLTDYNLTMPLAFDNDVSIISESGRCWAGTDVMAGDGPCIYMENDTISKDPLRAICEVLVTIALEKRK